MDDVDEAAGGVPAGAVLVHSPARSDDIFSDDSPAHPATALASTPTAAGAATANAAAQPPVPGESFTQKPGDGCTALRPVLSARCFSPHQHCIPSRVGPLDS